MNIEVTRILGDGSIRRARIEPEERSDAARWRELVSRANLNLPPPYRPDPGRPRAEPVTPGPALSGTGGIGDRGMWG